MRQAVENGIIDITAIQTQVEEMEKQKYLKQHNHKIWQGKDGWFCTYVYVLDKRKLIKKHTIEDVEKAIVEELKRPTLPTLKTVFEKAINQKIRYNEICAGTSNRYTIDFKKYFSDVSKTTFEKINEEWLEDIIKSKIADLHLTQKQFSNMRTIVKLIFIYAKKEKLTDISITAFFAETNFSVKAFAKKKKKKQVFKVDEIPKMIEYLLSTDNVTYLAIAFDFYTGLRAGELCSIRFSDIDGSSLHVQRQEIRYKIDIEGDDEDENNFIYEIVEYTKTEAGDRIIFLPDEALDIIEKVKSLNNSTDYIFMNENNRIHACTFNHYLYSACEKLNMEKLSMHKIRKTYGTTLIDAGVDDSLIMSQMGHSDIRTTRSYYYFSNKDDDKKLEQIRNAINFNVKSI